MHLVPCRWPDRCQAHSDLNSRYPARYSDLHLDRSGPCLDRSDWCQDYWHQDYWHQEYWHQDYWHQDYWHQDYWRQDYWRQDYWRQDYWRQDYCLARRRDWRPECRPPMRDSATRQR